MELRGKRALVTGAGRRLGAAIAVALGELGMRVIVHHRASPEGASETCRAIAAAGGEAVSLTADLLDPAAARELVDRSVEVFGGLDLLVSSAASYDAGGIEEEGGARWARTLALNLTAPLELAARATPSLRASRGAMVFVTCASRVAPYRGFLAYQTSKAALHHAVKLLALELAPDVRVNSVAPGSVLLPEHFGAAERAEIESRIPLGRVGEARDIADAVVHLARADWMTGTELIVDGGRSLR